MFSEDLTEKKYSLIFVAGFHLGFPLAFVHDREESSWRSIVENLMLRFAHHDDLFERVSVQYESETNFPLGDPITLRHRKFLNILPMVEYLTGAGFHFRSDEPVIDNRIWLLPTGVVLIFGKISFDSRNSISLSEFEERIIETHYPQLSYMFVQVARIIYEGLPPSFNKSAFAHEHDVNSSLAAIRTLEEFEKSADFNSDASSIGRYLDRNQTFSDLLSDILVDVYYFDYHFSEKEKINIRYVDSSITSIRPAHLLYITIAYSSFVGFLWLRKHLGEQSRRLQEVLVNGKRQQQSVSYGLKLLRIFSLRFINESSPISVRLTGEYITHLEDCWGKFRMDLLASQVAEQLGALEQMFDWIEETEKEDRNFKIGIAAVLLALISILAVAAQLVSTIDFANTVGWHTRAFLIVLGFVSGLVCALAIYLLPHRRSRL